MREPALTKAARAAWHSQETCHPRKPADDAQSAQAWALIAIAEQLKTANYLAAGGQPLPEPELADAQSIGEA